VSRLGALALLATLGAGCEPSAGPPPPAPSRLHVVASVYPVYEFARHVAGEAAEVALLIPPGVEPHDWEASPKDVGRVADARVFVHNGAGFEPWVDRLLAGLGDRRPAVVAAAAGLELLDALPAADPHGHGHPPPRRERAAGPAPAKDPHVWLDPVLAAAQVEAIRAGLAAADPPNAARYAAGAEAFAARLRALHERFEQGLASCQRREIVVSHAAFTYPARRYRLTQIPITGAAPDAEPSPAELARIVRVARRHRVSVVFFEPLVASRLADALARELGARTLPLNPIEGLTREEAARGTGYVALMEKNLAHLRDGLGCR